MIQVVSTALGQPHFCPVICSAGDVNESNLVFLCVNACKYMQLSATVFGQNPPPTALQHPFFDLFPIGVNWSPTVVKRFRRRSWALTPDFCLLFFVPPYSMTPMLQFQYSFPHSPTPPWTKAVQAVNLLSFMNSCAAHTKKSPPTGG